MDFAIFLSLSLCIIVGTYALLNSATHMNDIILLLKKEDRLTAEEIAMRIFKRPNITLAKRYLGILEGQGLISCPTDRYVLTMKGIKIANHVSEYDVEEDEDS